MLPLRLSFTKHSGQLETRASGINISLEIFRLKFTGNFSLSASEIKNVVYSRTNQEIMGRKSNGKEVPGEAFSGNFIIILFLACEQAHALVWIGYHRQRRQRTENR